MLRAITCFYCFWSHFSKVQVMIEFAFKTTIDSIAVRPPIGPRLAPSSRSRLVLASSKKPYALARSLRDLAQHEAALGFNSRWHLPPSMIAPSRRDLVDLANQS